jgi:hypothetical protein
MRLEIRISWNGFLQVKEREKQQAMYIEDTQVSYRREIEILQVVYYLVVSRGGEDKIISLLLLYQ